MKARKGFSDTEKNMMMLPKETQDGIHITGMQPCLKYQEFYV